jgi:antitoxin component YwqK of YwqJK toxin-antitoxin module
LREKQISARDLEAVLGPLTKTLEARALARGTGRMTIIHPKTRKVVSINHFVNGLPEGPQQIFYPNGSLLGTATFEKGLISGISRYFRPDSSLAWSFIFRNGLPEGPAQRYTPCNEGQEAPVDIVFYRKGLQANPKQNDRINTGANNR